MLFHSIYANLYVIYSNNHSDFIKVTNRREVPLITATNFETVTDVQDGWFDIRADVVTKYMYMTVNEMTIVNVELQTARSSQELLSALYLAYNRSVDSIPVLIEMLGYVRRLKHLIVDGK